MKWNAALSAAAAVLGLTALLTGCGGEPDTPSGPIPLPEGTKLTGFYISHQGMAMEPYLLLNMTDEGIYLKITDCSPETWRTPDGDWTCLSDAGRVMEGETAQVSLLTSRDKLDRLEEAVAAAGALGWDGYDVHRSEKAPADTGERYELYLELSDASTVTVRGYNACPEGFLELYQQAKEIIYDET